MMLFDSSIRKELARSFGAALVVLVTVVMTMMLIRTLGQASKGSIGPSDVMLVMGLTVLGYLPTILTLSLFIAVVGTLSRMYRDSEMAIWFASGQGLAALSRPLLRFAWPIVLAVGALMLLAWPWSNQQVLELRTQFEQRSDIDRIAPGEFQESSDGSRVIFIDKERSDTGVASNVFVLESRQGREYVTSARAARVEHDPGAGRSAVLSHGQRVEIALAQPQDGTTPTEAGTNAGQQSTPEQGGLKLTQFREYRVRLDEGSAAQAELSIRATPTHALVWGGENGGHDGKSAPVPPRHMAELAWRISQPLVALNLVVLALAMTTVNPRTGRSTSLALALLAFIVYYNLTNAGTSWVAAQRISMPALLLGLHGGMLALGTAMLAVRHYRWSMHYLLPQRGKGSDNPGPARPPARTASPHKPT